MKYAPRQKPLSPSRMTQLAKTKAHLQGVIDLIERVERLEITQTEMAHDLDMTPQELNNLFSCYFHRHVKKLKILDVDEIINVLNKSQSPYEELFKDVIGSEVKNDEFATVPAIYIDRDYHSVMFERLSDALKPQTFEVLRRYYGLDCPAESAVEISEAIGLTRSRVNQIIDLGLANLRHPYRINALFPNDECILALNTEIANQSEVIQRYKKILQERMDNSRRLKHVVQKQQQNTVRPHMEYNPTIHELMMDNPQLSTRTYNGLCRAGIKTLADLASIDMQKLMNTPHFGEKCCSEILALLAMYGLKPTISEFE